MRIYACDWKLTNHSIHSITREQTHQFWCVALECSNNVKPIGTFAHVCIHSVFSCAIGQFRKKWWEFPTAGELEFEQWNRRVVRREFFYVFGIKISWTFSFLRGDACDEEVYCTSQQASAAFSVDFFFHPRALHFFLSYFHELFDFLFTLIIEKILLHE